MLAQLKDISLFHTVEEDDLRSLAARAKNRSVESGRLVFNEGEEADALYIVLSGAVKIFLNHENGRETLLATKRAGDYFGEMMLDHRPRSASVMTLEPSQFAVISRDDFKGFLRRHPDAAEKVILNLIHVTRAMNERAREGMSLSERLRQYIKWLEGMKAPELPTVRRWVLAKRWVLGGLLVLAVVHYYYVDVFLQILTTSGLTVFTR